MLNSLYAPERTNRHYVEQESVSSQSMAEVGSGRAWQRVVKQTLEAVLYEGLVDAVVAPCIKARAGSSDTVYFGLGGRGYSCRGRRGGFDRLRLKLGSLRRVGIQQPRVNLSDFLRELVDSLPGDTARKRQFWQELMQTINWCEWNEKHLESKCDRRTLNFVQLETALDEGHPYHPCFKARSGFSNVDHQRFSPEVGSPIKLQWLAVPNEQVVAHGASASKDFWKQELGEALLHSLEVRCRARGGQPSDYTFVPVHPWQWQNRLIEHALRADFREAEPQPRKRAAVILDLGQPGDDYVASQSLRTLLNVRDPLKANVKLPLDIVSTSSNRNLLSHGVDSGPDVSRWLADLVEQDRFFETFPLVILQEYASVRVLETPFFSNVDPQVCRLGAIWRESVDRHLRVTEKALPMTALCVTEADGKPFIDPWILRYGLEPWLAQLFTTLIFPVWHLLASHGIALESHAQNSILIHDDGWPQRLALRDFHESLEYMESFLAEPERMPDCLNSAFYQQADANEFYRMASVEALRDLQMDTLYVFHLSDLAELCDRYYQMPEPRFWALVKRCLDAYQDGGYSSEARQNKVNLYTKEINVESLIRKKLCPEEREYHHRVSNALAGWTPSQTSQEEE